MALTDHPIVRAIGNRTVIFSTDNGKISMEILLRGKHLATLVFEATEAMVIRTELTRLLRDLGIFVDY
jgi:hypothetical protein